MYDHHQRYYVSPLADSDGGDIPPLFHLPTYGIKRVRAQGCAEWANPDNGSYGGWVARNGQRRVVVWVGVPRVN